MIRKSVIAATMLLAGCDGNGAMTPVARSPDGRVEIVAGRLREGLGIRVRHDGADVIAPSPVGLELAGRPLRALVLASVSRHGDEVHLRARERDGQRRSVLIRLKALDGGAAFRIELPPASARREVAAELTQLRFPRDYHCLAVSHTKLVNSHEGDYAPTRASALKPGTLYDLPLTCRTGRQGETIALAESDWEEYPGAYLVKGERPGVAVRPVPLPARDHVLASVPAGRPLRTPWRVVMIGDRPERLVGNSLVHDLASPSRIGDAGWIRPGKAAWAWWSGVKASGVPGAGFNNRTYRHYIDFAAHMGLPYFVIDWGWAARPRGDKHLADVTDFRPGVNIPELVRYAAQRKVRLWLWTNWDAIGPNMDRVFALYQRWGIAGIKVDYVYRQDQVAIGFYHRLLAAAARHRLMVNIHGSPVPRGLERTYPNLLTQEGVMGAEYNKWSRKVMAGANVRLAYTRAAIGPMDYTPGGFRNVTPGAFRARHVMPLVMTTRAHQLAQFVAYSSPLQSLADAPQAYLPGGRPAPGTEFVRMVPAAWDETRGVAGAWGRWIAVARRHGSRWFVGVLNDEQARTVPLPLGFLGRGRWRLRALVDGATPTDLKGHAGAVLFKHNVRVPLASSGGAVLVLDPL